ncbi:MAG TPA: FixH family protein [Methylophilaceae bacterium]|nr:FixH family protein [Methylophilaceae bacterium]
MPIIPEIAMTETLFGGLILAAFIFFITRRLCLSNFWAGILSGVIPFLAYVAYSSQHWAGGDVLTIHFAVYLATAGLLMVFGGMQQKKQSLHWAPRIIIGFFISLVMLNALLLTISTRGLPDKISGMFLPNPENQKIHTAFPGVIPHDRNKLYEPHLLQIEQQRKLAWQVDIDGLKKLQSNKPQLVKITVLDSQHQPIIGGQVRLGMWRMANSRDDRIYDFKETSTGIYEAELLLPEEGRWLSELSIQQGENSYLKQQQLLVDGD